MPKNPWAWLDSLPGPQKDSLLKLRTRLRQKMLKPLKPLKGLPRPMLPRQTQSSAGEPELSLPEESR